MVISDDELVAAIQTFLGAKNVCISETRKERIASNSIQLKIQEEGEETKNLHVKLCVEDSQSGKLNKVLQIFDREIFFYSKVLPKLTEFQEQNQKTICSQLDFSSLFFKYFGSLSIDGKACLILLERFLPKDYYVTSVEQFFSLQQIHYCMEKIALFHATSFSMSKKNGVSLRNYDPLLNDALFHPSSKAVSEAYFISIFESNLKILSAIKEETKKRNSLVQDNILSFNSMSDSVLKRLKNIAPHLAKILFKTLECPEELMVITHGDFHMWNIAFSNQGEMDAKFFDFQMLRVTSGMVDVHHLLSQVCTPSTRNKHLYQFIETYYQSFKRACLNLGVNEDEILYTQETINKEYMLRSPWGFVFGFCFILPRFISNQLLSTDFYELLKETNDSSEIVDLMSKRCSPNIWSVLGMYVDMVQVEDDLGTLKLMEDIAANN